MATNIELNFFILKFYKVLKHDLKLEDEENDFFILKFYKVLKPQIYFSIFIYFFKVFLLYKQKMESYHHNLNFLYKEFDIYVNKKEEEK